MEEKKEPRVITDEQAKEIAQGLIQNKYFMSDQVREPQELGMVFMPLMLMPDEQLKSLKEEGIQYLYAEFSKALPKGFNGYPIFAEMRCLTKADYEKVIGYETKLRQSMKDALKEADGKPEHCRSGKDRDP